MMRPMMLAAALAMATPAFGDPSFWSSEWPNTDFNQTSVGWTEVLSGGPPKDGIPALFANQITFGPVSDSEIPDREPVMTVEIDGHAARAYPVRYLTWHEIVNDRIGDVPVTVTFCPLCNSAIVFDGRLDGAEYTFGVSGKLRNSDMIMYDHTTESWWQQFTGEAIVGELLGKELTTLPAILESHAAFEARHPGGSVMNQPTHVLRRYGANPYVGYDSSYSPFLYNGERPPHDIEPLARVVRVGANAWPLERLRGAGTLEEAGVRLVWEEGQASALDTRSIDEGKEVGNVRVFDAATGAPSVYEVVFAFAFHAFEPEGTWHLGQ